MDAAERIVLRRKKVMLSNNLILTDQQLTRIWEEKLLKKSDYDLIKGESTNIGRVGRLVDALPVEGFNFLCEQLAEQNEWLSDELKTELKAELGQLQVEDYINKEAAVLVHREFGASKRLAQNEKLKLTTLVAARTQFAKDVWRRQLERARKALEETKNKNAEKDFRAQQLATRVESFLQENRQRLRRVEETKSSSSSPNIIQNGHNLQKLSLNQQSADGEQKKKGEGINLVSTKENGGEKTRSGEPEVEAVLVALASLGTMIEEVICLTEECSADREGLLAERACLLETLKIDPDDKITPVDARLKHMLATAAQELEMARDKVRFREAKAAELEHKLHECWIESEKKIETKDETINQTSEQLKILQEKATDLELSIRKLEAELRNARSELRQYKERTARLEKNRRLGYKSDGQGSGIRFPAIKDGDRIRSCSSRRPQSQATSLQVIDP